MTAAACTNTKYIQSEVVLSSAGHACGDVSIKTHSLVPFLRQDDRARPDLTFSLRRRDACPRLFCCVVKRAVEISGHKTILFLSAKPASKLVSLTFAQLMEWKSSAIPSLTSSSRRVRVQLVLDQGCQVKINTCSS